MINLRACRTSALVSLLLFFHCISTKAAQVALQERRVLASVAGSVEDSQTRHSVAEARVVLQRGRLARPANTNENSGASVVTDSEGHFRFDSINPGEYTLYVTKRAYLTSAFHVVDLQAGKTKTLGVRLDPLVRLSGRVVDEAGRGIRDARVTPLIGSTDRNASLTQLLNEHGIMGLVTNSDSRGAFELFWPSDERDATLFAEAPSFAPSKVALDLSKSHDERNNVIVILHNGLTARGRVLGNDGIPIFGATITGVRVEPRVAGLGVSELSPSETTDKRGAFALKGLMPGAYRLTIRHATHATLTVAKVQIEGPSAELSDIILPSEVKIEGRVTDVVGNPIGGARIVGRVPDDDITVETLTDNHGHFALDHLALGARVLLRANALGYVSANKTVEAPQNDADLVLGRLGTVRGHLEDADSARSLSEFRIWSTSSGEEKRFHSSDGSFDWDGVPPGRWSLAAQAPGYQKTTIEIEVRSGELTDAGVIPLRRGFELSGRVVDFNTGEALPDISVVYEQISEQHDASQFDKTMQTTDSDGNFKFNGVPAGKINIMTWSPLYADAQATVTADEERFIEIRLSRGGTVSGRVLGPDKMTPLSGARVSLASEATGKGVAFLTDSAGSFAFDRLSPDSYTLTAQSSFGQASPQHIAVGENQRTEGLVLNVKSGATIHGKVRGILPIEQKTVNLTVSGPGGFSAFTTTDAASEYTISGVPTGTTQLLVYTSSFRSVSISVQIGAGIFELTRDIDFPQSARLHGRLMQGGKPISFADVTLIPVEPQMVRASARTNEDGVYDVPGLSDGNYFVRTQGLERRIHVSGDTILDLDLSGNN